MLKGIAASPGVEMGQVFFMETGKLTIKRVHINHVSIEVRRLEEALKTAKMQVQELRELTRKKMGQEKAEIFEAHLMMLEDVELFGQVKQKIEAEYVNAEWALKEVCEVFLELFESIPDEYMRERAADLKDIVQRLTENLLGIERADLSRLDKKVIVVAKDLLPSDTAKMNKDQVLAFITEDGGKTSHAAIMAKSMGIPAVVGVNGLLSSVKNGDTLIVYGDSGEIILNPGEEEIIQYNETKKSRKQFTEMLEPLKDCASVSKDGKKVEIAANIGSPKDIEAVLQNGAEGIGLFRSEFLYMEGNSLPIEEKQFQAYREVAEAMKDKPVVIRTLDIGGDKELNCLKLPKEENPFLGYRAIRICLDKQQIFAAQLRALLRASQYGNIKIMFPMISSMEELRQAKAALEDAKAELRKEKIPFNEQIEVGIMVEIPAAALLSDIMAKEVDFFSIGTNDLIQYTIAVDRMNPKVSHLYNQYHPALLRLINQVITNAHKQNIWVGMCGEAASDAKLIPVFLGMGLDEFSMNSRSILKARWIIKNTSAGDMEKLIDKIIGMSTAEEIEKLLEENLVNIGGSSVFV